MCVRDQAVRCCPKFPDSLLFIPSGTARRKKKVIHKSSGTDDKKLQTSLKKLQVSNIPGIEEVWSQFKTEYYKPTVPACSNWPV